MHKFWSFDQVNHIPAPFYDYTHFPGSFVDVVHVVYDFLTNLIMFIRYFVRIFASVVLVRKTRADIILAGVISKGALLF